MKAKFIGQVRGYSIDDNDDVHLTIDDTEVSQEALYYVHDMDRSFNPQARIHGYDAKDVPCNIRPCMAGYYFTLSKDKARGISFGSTVEVELDIFNVRKVKFFNKKWGYIAEMRHELLSIRAIAEKRQEVNSGAEVAGNKK